MPRNVNGKSPDLCNEDGCFSLRFQTPKHRYQKCETHMRETWRKYAANDDADSPPRRERPAARKPVVRSEPSDVGVQYIAPIESKPGICPLCCRTPKRAARAALHRNLWCQSCTPMSTPYDELESRINADLPMLRKQLAESESNLEAANLLISDLSEIKTRADAPATAPTPGGHKIMLIDNNIGLLHYFDGCTHRHEPLPLNGDFFTKLDEAEAAGYLVCKHYSLIGEAT